MVNKLFLKNWLFMYVFVIVEIKLKIEFQWFQNCMYRLKYVKNLMCLNDVEKVFEDFL